MFRTTLEIALSSHAGRYAPTHWPFWDVTEAAEAKHRQSIAMAAYDQFAWFKREIMTNDARSSTLSKLAEAVAAGPVIGDGLVLRAAQGRVPPDEERAPRRSNAGDHSQSPPKQRLSDAHTLLEIASDLARKTACPARSGLAWRDRQTDHLY